MSKDPTRDKLMASAREERLEVEGLCVICGKRTPKLGCKRCEECLERNAESFQEYKMRKLSEGLCTTCGIRPVKPRRSKCEGCLEKDSNLKREYMKRAKADRLCYSSGCYEPQSDGVCCSRHAEMRRKSARRLNRNHIAQAKINGTCYNRGCHELQSRGVYCSKHYDDLRAWYDSHPDYENVKSRARYASLISLGLCSQCEKPREENGSDTLCWRCKIELVMSGAIRNVLTRGNHIKGWRHWEEFVDYSLDDLLRHIQYWKDIQGLNGQPTELHHINKRSESLWQESGDEEWRRLWSLSNLIPLTIEDHKAANRGDVDKLHPAVATYIREYTLLKDDSEPLLALATSGVGIPLPEPRIHSGSNIGEINMEVN